MTDYLTVTEAAKRLSVDRRTLQNWCRDGKVPGAIRTPGGHWRVPVEFVERERAV